MENTKSDAKDEMLRRVVDGRLYSTPGSQEHPNKSHFMTGGEVWPEISSDRDRKAWWKLCYESNWHTHPEWITEGYYWLHETEDGWRITPREDHPPTTGS